MAHTPTTRIAQKEKYEALYRAILLLESEEECHRFFEDLCTVTELRSMEQRFEVARLLRSGCIYNEIMEKTGASSATITRVSRCLNFGAEGYTGVLEKMGE